MDDGVVRFGPKQKALLSIIDSKAGSITRQQQQQQQPSEDEIKGETLKNAEHDGPQQTAVFFHHLLLINSQRQEEAYIFFFEYGTT